LQLKRRLKSSSVCCEIGACALALVFSAGCGTHRVSGSKPDVNLATPVSFVDLQPGWRLRVITPLLASGKRRIENGKQEASGSTFTIRSDEEFLGYETDYYEVVGSGRGVTIQFRSAEVRKGDVVTRPERPTTDYFKEAQHSRHVRLVFLQRASSADHNMAVISSKRTGLLEKLTEMVETDPETCDVQARGTCFWIPAGIAVRPELMAAGVWEPAR
jgi:hypothetical protein